MKPPLYGATVCFVVVYGFVSLIRTRNNVSRSILSSDKAQMIAFHWDSVADKGLCGSDKCFFRDLNDESIGYLVSRNKRNDEDQDYVHQIHEGYKLACYLHQAHGIEHFLLGPPFSVDVTATILRAHLRNRHPLKAQRPMYTDKHPAIVQMVNVAPPHVMFLKSNTENSGIVQKLENVWKANHTFSSFVQRLSQDLTKTLDILYSVPLLANDFQIMMDCRSGAIYHFDFDRFVAGIFDGNFAETFPKRHANSVRTIQVALDWAKNKSTAQQQQEVSTNAALRNADKAKNGDFSILQYEKNNTSNCTEKAAIYVDFHFRWKGHRMHPLARNMLLDYVLKRWNYMQNNSMNNCLTLQ